ncbi:hypothetical protein CI610_03356 [invertebrate metagenome]|uniref:Reverse transcriptase domain-containing protein n=1 Tax=invertebrate metagenome TaxID=1711999 RepID=A0A2H9T3A5_9ZZZZ
MQGGSLSAKMYLVFINDLLIDVELSGKGAFVIDTKVNIPTQADDICLISNTSVGLQDMVTICESYSCKWRFSFSVDKSKIVVFTKGRKQVLVKDVYLYGKVLPVVENITHVGVVLNFKLCSSDRTESACKKMKSGTMALVRSGAHPRTLNPLTVSKMIKTKVFPSALYGCELWQLSRTELIKLERAQNFIVKSIQGLNIRTRTDMAISLIGWTTIEGYIDIRKLLFLWSSLQAGQ